jgi:hypothetical protein
MTSMPTCPRPVWFLPVVDLWLVWARQVMQERREQQARWRAADPERARNRVRAWVAANKERHVASRRKYAIANRQAFNARSRAWTAANPEKKRQVREGWIARNPEKSREVQRNYQRASYRANPNQKLARLSRARLYQALKDQKAVKSAKTLDLLGCEVAFLRVHLESRFRDGMTWDNYGPHWHVDHIKPCAKFDLTDPEQQRQCFHFTNLQPLLGPENIAKSDRYEEANERAAA